MPSSRAPKKYVLELAPEAEDDIRDILQYTYETWGAAQVPVYKAVLDKALALLRSSPGLGRSRAGYKVLQAGQHLIVHRLSEQMIYVVRVLHERMDFERHVPNEDEDPDE